MKVNVFKKSSSEVELTIELTPNEVEPYERRAVEELGKNVQLAGFRRGKAPAHMLRKSLDPMRIFETTANIAIPQVYAKAVLEQKLETVGSPKIELQKFAPGNPLIFKAVVAIVPSFSLPDYKKVAVKHEPVKVTDEEVDRFIRNVQRTRATEKKVERAAKSGDVVVIDFNLTQKKVPLEHGQGQQHRLVIGENTFIPGFEEQLVGLTAGAEKDFSVTFPKDYGKKNLAGQPADVHVKVHSVNERVLPVLDDAFARGLGSFKDLADLKTKLKENLRLEAESRERERFEIAVLNALAAKTTVEIPQVLLEGELNKMAEELERSMVSQGANFQDYLTSLGKTLDQLKRGWVEQAKKRVTIGLLLRRIAKTEGVSVSDDEIAEEVNATLRQHPGSKQIERTVKSPAYRDFVSEVIRNRKTIKLLSSWAEGSTSNA